MTKSPSVKTQECQFCRRKRKHWKYSYLTGFELGLKMGSPLTIVKEIENPVWIDTTNKWMIPGEKL